MERRFWFVTLMFFMAVMVCFLLVASQHVSGTVAPVVASPACQSQTDVSTWDDSEQWTTESITSNVNSRSGTP